MTGVEEKIGILVFVETALVEDDRMIPAVSVVISYKIAVSYLYSHTSIWSTYLYSLYHTTTSVYQIELQPKISKEELRTNSHRSSLCNIKRKSVLEGVVLVRIPLTVPFEEVGRRGREVLIIYLYIYYISTRTYYIIFQPH